MCRVLKVSTSGFYDWQKRKDAPATPTAKARQKRCDLIEEIYNATGVAIAFGNTVYKSFRMKVD